MFRKITTENVQETTSIAEEVKQCVQRSDVNRIMVDLSSQKSVGYREESLRDQVVANTNITLPNVKELTKKFARAAELTSKSCRPVVSHTVNEDIPNDLSKGSNENSTNVPIDGGSVTSRPGICVMIESSDPRSRENLCMEADENKEAMQSPSAPVIKSGAREIHSLTARSISKEFREELKNSSNRNRLLKMDRGSSGESDHAEIVSESARNRSPTPPIDLRSKRKFWEDIISNSDK